MFNFSVIITLLGLLSTSVHGTKKVVKYKYASGSSNSYAEAYWQGDGCINSNDIAIFFADGFYKSSGSPKQLYKSLSGHIFYYTDCDSLGATEHHMDFYADPPSGVIKLVSLRNATVDTKILATYTKRSCVIVTETYEDIEYSYYDCGESYESGETEIHVDVITKSTGGAYESYYTGYNRGPGYYEQYKGSSKCKEGRTTWEVTIGDQPLPLPSTDIFSDICKVNEGYTTRYYY